MNRLDYLFTCLFAGMNLDVCDIPQHWWSWKAPCVVFHVMISYRKGIFCAHFWSTRENCMPCQKVWCASCYKVPEGNRFPIRLPKDEDGNVLVNEEEKTRFLRARVGDHVLCPFQCELCHFRNMQGRSPMKVTGVLNDEETIDLFRRVNLDAFWSREPTAIGHKLSKVNRVLQISHELGLDTPPVPRLGPWPVEDKFGMGAAIMLLKHSLDPGATETTVQYNTVRNMKSAFVNLYHASVENQGNIIVGGKDGKRFVSMDAPIYSDFFGRFQAGMHNRMGDKVVQDFGLSR
jgi:hypothetical protein